MTSIDDRAQPPDDEPAEVIAVIVIDPTFPLGQIVTTPAANAALEAARRSPFEFIKRHGNRDWGELDEEDRATNDYAADHEQRLLSAYKLDEATKLWIITEWDRSVTTILLPQDY